MLFPFHAQKKKRRDIMLTSSSTSFAPALLIRPSLAGVLVGAQEVQ
jgi:hypothetical protein